METKIRRSLQNVRTMTGIVDYRSSPFRSYMKLSVLEMEKYRRGRERTSALAKVRAIDERFKDIDAEKLEILASMELDGVQPGRPRDRKQLMERVPAGEGSFKIKY